jgi:hypothetical protein
MRYFILLDYFEEPLQHAYIPVLYILLGLAEKTLIWLAGSTVSVI